MNEANEASPLVSNGPSIQTVREGVHLLRGQGNSFVIELDEGLVLVDAGPGGKVSKSMIETVRGMGYRLDAPA